MAQQMINDQTFSPDSIARLKAGAGSTRGMTVAGARCSSRSCCSSSPAHPRSSDGSYADRVIEATSGPSWLLGYFLLIALSFLAVANPRLAPIGVVYAVLMGLWVGGYRRSTRSPTTASSRRR